MSLKKVRGEAGEERTRGINIREKMREGGRNVVVVVVGVYFEETVNEERGKGGKQGIRREGAMSKKKELCSARLNTGIVGGRGGGERGEEMKPRAFGVGREGGRGRARSGFSTRDTREPGRTEKRSREGGGREDEEEM